MTAIVAQRQCTDHCTACHTLLAVTSTMFHRSAIWQCRCSSSSLCYPTDSGHILRTTRNARSAIIHLSESRKRVHAYARLGTVHKTVDDDQNELQHCMPIHLEYAQ